MGGRDPHGSVERLGIPAPSCGTGVSWTEISLFAICGRETEVTTKLGFPQLALNLVSMGQTAAWMAGLMNNGYNFRVEIPLVVSVAGIPLVVLVDTVGATSAETVSAPLAPLKEDV